MDPKKKAKFEKRFQNLLAQKEAKVNNPNAKRYVFENKTNGELELARAAENNQTIVPKGQQFVGDEYFFQFVPSQLKYVRELAAPVTHDRLIVEQPPTVVAAPANVGVKEAKLSQEDVCLLLEQPLDGVKIVKK